MPILVAVAEPTTPVNPDAILPAPTYPATAWQWTSPTGRVRQLLTDHPYLVPGGVVGHMAAPVSLIDSLPPGLDGGVYRGQRYEPRDVFLTMIAHTRDSAVWRDTYRQLVADFDTSAGAGTLTVAHTDGSTRSLSCRYVTGLESPEGGEPGAVKIGRFIAQLRAYDPWWYGPQQSRVFVVQSDVDFLPGPPFTIMPTELAGSGSLVTNPGDVEAFPRWTITGPVSEVSATAQDGSSWTVSYLLDAGETITVDCDPRVSPFARVVSANGSNLWGIATPDYPDLWPLPAGESTVTVAASGASSATSIRMDWYPRYRTA